MIFTDTAPATSAIQIDKVERKYGIRFPSAYVDHLLKYNGGTCQPDLFSFVEDGIEDESRIHYFFAIGSGDSNDLENCIDDLNGEGRIEKHFIPIATDPFGNCILISCREDNFGEILFWNHENEFEEDYVPSFIAEGIVEFLDSLYAHPK